MLIAAKIAAQCCFSSAMDNSIAKEIDNARYDSTKYQPADVHGLFPFSQETSGISCCKVLPISGFILHGTDFILRISFVCRQGAFFRPESSLMWMWTWLWLWVSGWRRIPALLPPKEQVSFCQRAAKEARPRTHAWAGPAWVRISGRRWF